MELVVVSRSASESEEPLDSVDKDADANDTHNHPRHRRALILQHLRQRQTQANVKFVTPPCSQAGAIRDYDSVHSKGLLAFLTTAWKEWEDLGDGRDPDCALRETTPGVPPPLVPLNVPLPRCPHQRPSKNVMGKVAYFCTDLCTPIVARLKEELTWDAAVVNLAVHESFQSRACYAVTTHPGHHAAHDSFGGYCYINHAAYAARSLQSRLGGGSKVAILDVDYHCGNGTASIFYEDPTVLVVSLHCDPDFDYPFHSGFSDQTGAGDGVGTTLHLPLSPGTTWEDYKVALQQGLNRIVDFGAKALVVSLGLDTHEGDEVSIRRAGFKLIGDDFSKVGQTIGRTIRDIPTVFIQEGGYKMDVVGKVATDVVVGFCEA